MSEHQRETAFLRHIIRHGDSDECRTLDKRIAQIQCDQRCVQRVAAVTALFPFLALIGVGYGGILAENFPYNGSEFVFRLLCELGLASLICLVAFAGLLIVYRLKLNRLREEGRHLVKKLVTPHLIKPHIATFPGSHPVAADDGAFQGAADVSGC